jgi:hypothetical protein
MFRRYRKLPLTTKDINKGFYKGNRTGSMGRHTKFGGYVIEWEKVRTYVVPEGMAQFKVSEGSLFQPVAMAAVEDESYNINWPNADANAKHS